MSRRLFPPALTVALLFGSLFFLAGPGRGDDLTACDGRTLPLTRQIRCKLWQIGGFTRPLLEGGNQRGTGRISLGPDRWAEVQVNWGDTGANWPESMRFRLYHGSGGEGRLVEEVTDRGLNGLDPAEVGDAFRRNQGDSGLVDLLPGLDPKLVEPLNRDYLSWLAEILGALESRGKVHEPVTWRRLDPGMETAEFKALRYVRLGDNTVFLLRLDPRLYSFVPMHWRESEGWEPTDIIGWSERAPEAAALFNAGLYDSEYRYLGLLLKDGQDLGFGLHSNWKALLLSGGPDGDPGRPPTTILDLQVHRFNPADSPYRYALQSFMLLDAGGRSRVRLSDQLASRTAVAQDKRGRILVVQVPGACTLHELALLLAASELEVRQAMALDGGLESQVLVRAGPRNLLRCGAWVVNEKRRYYAGGLRLPLPAVVAVVPRTPSP
ncbi:MAG: phosphodiester glycosidase family protein [Thermodesulfobacteriota bacterium]